MNKQFSQKIYIGLALTILGIELFLLAPTYVEANGLIDVVFEGEPEPLFKEANFLPGQEVVRWVEVTNKSAQSLPVGVEMTSLICSGSDDYYLADKLNLIIKDKDSNKLYENFLTGFFSDGEKKIADLAAGNTEKYYFSITFLPESGDNYQGLEVGFNFQIGALGTESIGGEGSGGGTSGGSTGGGGGGHFITGLEISNENAFKISETSVTIIWDTSYDSTSRVIYSSGVESHVLQLDNLPDYGYAHSKEGDDSGSEKVTSHSVTITGLTSETTYYYRCVSHGSLAISTEYSFTTLGVEEAGEEVEPALVSPGGETSMGKEEKIEREIEEGVGVVGRKEGEEEEGKEEIRELEKPELVEVGTEEPIELGKFLAAIGALPLNLKVILIILALILIGLLILWLIKKKRERKEGSV